MPTVVKKVGFAKIQFGENIFMTEIKVIHIEARMMSVSQLVGRKTLEWVAECVKKPQKTTIAQHFFLNVLNVFLMQYFYFESLA